MVKINFFFPPPPPCVTVLPLKFPKNSMVRHRSQTPPPKTMTSYVDGPLPQLTKSIVYIYSVLKLGYGLHLFCLSAAKYYNVQSLQCIAMIGLFNFWLPTGKKDDVKP
jgi:hypothetical protein